MLMFIKKYTSLDYSKKGKYVFTYVNYIHEFIMIFINDTLSTYGGSITLLLRMFKWLTKQHIQSAMITDSQENCEAVTQLREMGITIFQADIRNGHEIIPILKQYDEDLKVINFYWDKYLDIECAKKNGQLAFDNIMYNIHPAAFDKGSSRGDSFLTRSVKEMYYSILRKMNQNGSLVYMDPINIRHTERYYSREFEKRPTIVRLPMDCNGLNVTIDELENRFNSNIILTASRADFPYKGYLLGLIDIFVRLAKKKKDVQLEIIAGGGNSDILDKKLSEIDDDIRKRIIYKKWMTYDELKQEIRRAKVFVGMGTSIIDSARVRIPSIPVLFDTYDCISNGLFHEFGEITAYEDCTLGIENSLNTVLDASFEEYLSISKLTFEKMSSEYDIDKIMQGFISMSTKNKSCILNNKEYILHKVNNIKNKILYTGKGYSYNNVKGEN